MAKHNTFDSAEKRIAELVRRFPKYTVNQIAEIVGVELPHAHNMVKRVKAKAKPVEISVPPNDPERGLIDLDVQRYFRAGLGISGIAARLHLRYAVVMESIERQGLSHAKIRRGGRPPHGEAHRVPRDPMAKAL